MEENMVNGTVINLTCTVSRIKPEAMIYWMIDGHRENGSDSVTTNEDGTFKQTNTIRYVCEHLLPTARESNVFTGICYSVHNWPHAYSVTAHPCWPLMVERRNLGFMKILLP